MNTQTAIKLAGSATALAELLGITGSAIAQWGESLPELRVYKLREVRPEWFEAQETRAQAAPETVAAAAAEGGANV